MCIAGLRLSTLTPVRPTQSTDAGYDSHVDNTIRLLHRRRGWIWTMVISVVAWVVTVALLGALAPNAKGAGQAFAGIFVLLLTIIAVVALVASIVDTVRLHRRDTGVRSTAFERTAHHPVRTHAYRYPPRHRFTWVFGWVMLVVIVGLGIGTLPGLVDGVAYLAGAENSASFVPVSYGQSCSRSGCRTITNGYLDVPGRPAVTWQGQVPLDSPRQVRQPLWDWAYGSELITSDFGAFGDITVGFLFEVATGFTVFVAVKLMRNWLRHRRGVASGLVT